MPLEDYKELVATAAGVTTVAQLFSPVFMCKEIIQNGNTKGLGPMTFIGGIAISILFLQYGLIINDPAMIPVNVFGCVLNVCYAVCFYLYTTEKTEFFTCLGKASAIVAVLIGYTQWEHKHFLEFRFGLIMTVLVLALIASPLFSLGEIIRKKNVESLPFPMIASGTVVSTLWLLYGIIIANTFMVVQNVVAVILCFIQLSLFAIYPSSPTNVDERKNK